MTGRSAVLDGLIDVVVRPRREPLLVGDRTDGDLLIVTASIDRRRDCDRRRKPSKLSLTVGRPTGGTPVTVL